eukprot:6214588-Pleurochrysis_carterae.AAC.1
MVVLALSIGVATALGNTALRNSTTVGSSTLNGGNWLSPSRTYRLKFMRIPLETSPMTYERGGSGRVGDTSTVHRYGRGGTSHYASTWCSLRGFVSETK